MGRSVANTLVVVLLLCPLVAVPSGALPDHHPIRAVVPDPASAARQSILVQAGDPSWLSVQLGVTVSARSVPLAQTVAISGNVTDTGGAIPLAAVVAAFDGFSVVNFTVSDANGSYVLGVPPNASYLLYVLPFMGAIVQGYYLHGAFVRTQVVTVADVDLPLDLSVIPAYELVLALHRADGSLANLSGALETAQGDLFATTGRWRTDLALRSEVGLSGGLSPAPSLLLPLGARRELHLSWPQGAMGLVRLRADANGTGYGGDASGGAYVDVLIEGGYTLLARVVALRQEVIDAGGSAGGMAGDEIEFDNALPRNGTPAQWAAFLEELGHLHDHAEFAQRYTALERIAAQRQGDLTTTVRDPSGTPVENASITFALDQGAFGLGVQDTYVGNGEVGVAALVDAGARTWAVPLPSARVQPQAGVFDLSYLQQTAGLSDLPRPQLYLQGEALLALDPISLASHMGDGSDLSALHANLTTYVVTLVERYGETVHTWEVGTSLESASAPQMDVDATLQLLVAVIAAVKQTDPTARVRLTVGTRHYGEGIAERYAPEAGPSQPRPYGEGAIDFVTAVLAGGPPIDEIGITLRGGGLGTRDGVTDMPVPSDDLSDLVDLWAALAGLGVPLVVASAAAPASAQGGGTWRGGWDQSQQSRWLLDVMTLAYGSGAMEGFSYGALGDPRSDLIDGGLLDGAHVARESYDAFLLRLQNWTTAAPLATAADGSALSRLHAGRYSVTATVGDVNVSGSVDVPAAGAASLELTLSQPLLPQLQVALDAPRPMVWGEGAQAALCVSIANVGLVAAPDVTVRLEPSSGATQDLQVGDLGPGERAFVQPIITLPRGALHLVAEVDPSDLIAEGNESDNIAQLDLKGAVVPDLWVGEVEGLGDDVAQGEPLSVAVTLHHPDIDLVGVVPVRVSVQSPVLLLPPQPRDLTLSSAATTIAFDGLVFTAAGAAEVTVRLEPTILLEQRTISNDEVTVVLQVVALPDLQLASVTLLDPPPTIGGTCVLEVTLDSETVRHAAVEVAVRSGAATLWSVPAAGSDQTSGVLLLRTPPLPLPADHDRGTLVVSLDPSDRVRERNESNNEVAVTFEARPPPGDVNLLSALSLRHPGNLTAGVPIDVLLSFEVRGARALHGSVAANLQDNGTILWAGSIPAVDGRVRWNISLVLPSGSRSLVAMIDPTHIVAESNEGDNEATLLLEVAAAPALPPVSPHGPTSSQAQAWFFPTLVLALVVGGSALFLFWRFDRSAQLSRPPASDVTQPAEQPSLVPPPPLVGGLEGPSSAADPPLLQQPTASEPPTPTEERSFEEWVPEAAPSSTAPVRVDDPPTTKQGVDPEEAIDREGLDELLQSLREKMDED